MGLNGKQLLENFKEDEAYGNTTYTPPDDSSDDDNGDNAWKYISAGDISGLADYTNRNYNYRTIPFLGQIVGHAADAATQGVADVAQFVGAQGVGDYLNEKAQEGEAELPAMSTPELSLAYLTDPNGLASAFGMMAGSMLSTAPVAAIAPELLPARAAMALSKVPKALSAVPKIGGALEEMAPMAGRFALTGPVEAMMEGGNTEREMLQNGATPEEARQAAWNVFGENVGLLTATNALEGGLLGKIKIKTPHFSNPVVNTAGRVAGYVPTTAAEMALQGYEEGAQQGIQNGVEGESPNTANQILNPFAWTDDQWDAAKLGVAGAVPLMGAMGAIRHFGNRGDNGSTAADSLLDQAQDDIDSITSQAAQQSVIQSAQQDMENNPYAAPTAMQDTSYEAPSDISDTSSGSSYDASALEGDPQYTVSGEVSSTDVTPLTDQKMRLLDSAYYNKYGQHLFVTSMKRNGDGGSWHDSGQAFDTADDNLENNKEARDWLISEGEKLGLTPLDEYEHPSAKATGGHIHFSDHGEPIPDGIRVGESDSDMDDSDTDDSTGGVDLSNLPVGDIAMAIAQNTNLPVNFIWSQLSHESDGGKSKLAVEDHNYGGVKGTDGNYLHFDNDQQFIDYMSKYYPKYREDGIYDAKTADQFAEALQHGGYFTADLGEYEGGMHRYLEQAGLSQDAMFGGKARRASRKGGDNTSSTPDLSGSFEISADDPAMDSMFASFAKDWQNMSTDANEINFFGDMFNSRNKFKATEENKQAILDSYGDAFRQYVQDNQPQTVQSTQTAQAPAQPKQAPQAQRVEMQAPNLDKAKAQQNVQPPTRGAQMPAVQQEAPRKTVRNVTAARLNNMLSGLSGDSFKKLDPIQKLAYLTATRAHSNVVGSEQTNNYIDSIISKVRHAAGFNGDGTTGGMSDAQQNAFYKSYMERMYDAALAIRRNATDDTPANLNDLDNSIQFLQQEVEKNTTPTKAAQTSTPVPRTAQAPKQAAPLSSISDSAIAAAKQANDGFSAPLNIFSADEQKAFRNAGLVYDDANYNGTERVKVDPLYEEGDRRMKRVKVKVKAETRKAGKADKYKKDAEKIYLRFKSGKFSADDSVNQLENLKKKATSDKALSDEEKAEVVAEADNQIHRIKPQKETKEHETQKHNSKTAKTTQSGEAEGYPHQDAEPEESRTDAEESEVRTRKAADTQPETKAREVRNQHGTDKVQNSDTVDSVLEAEGDGIPSNLADYVRGVTRENVASIPDKRKKFIDKAINTGAFRAIETDKGGYMLIGTKGGMFSSMTDLTPAETVYYAMHGGLDFNKRSTKEAIMDDLSAWYGSGSPREIETKKAADEIGREETKHTDTRVPDGLSKEAQGVYTAVRDKLRTGKSERARRAADVSAEILARHADAYAKAYSKATGKRYTAADYMRDKIGIDTDGNVVNNEKEKTFFQTAWHGSPHDFDQFDLGAIGTGEGAQVHGWGLYFAANREVSEGYIERLSDVIGHEIAKDGSIVQKSDEEWATIDNAPIDENTPPLVIALKLLREVRAKGNYNVGDAIQKLQWQYIQRMEDDIVASDFLTKWYKKFKYRNTLKNLKAAEQILKEGKYNFKNITSGHLFEVEIPDADTMLDEQLSYSDQPTLVQKAIDALYADRKKLAKEWKNLSAEDFKEIYHPSGEAWTYFMEWNRLRSLNWAFNAFAGEDIGNFLRETSSKNHYPESKIREIESSEQAYNKARNDVKRALENTESYLSKMVEHVDVSEDYHNMNGREVYQDYMNALMMYHNISRGLASKKTALALREHGVNGISYVGGRDGRCYVTFDDKTVKIINKYNQMMNGAAQGYTSALSDGKRIVTLLDSADESTFLHEMGHVFLPDLQDLAEIDQTTANDMTAVESWATWKKGQAKEYKGTAWEQEFADREKAIVKAMKDGDDATASQLKDEWMQERFARGFERYLESGEAPSSKLKSVFEKFKQFLTRIYNAFKGAGGKPSEDVKNVMARMMDSDVENTIKVPAIGEPPRSPWEKHQEAKKNAPETRAENQEKLVQEEAGSTRVAASDIVKDASIFGSVEDADREMLDALGLSEDDLTDDVLTAPDGIENTAEEREKLEKELAAELNKLSANPVFNPKIYTLGLKLAMTYVKDGINTVKKLVAKLNAKFGDKIGPWAPALAETVRTWPKGVTFDEKKVMAISKAVGARYENGITSLDDMQADMKKLLKGQHDSFTPMIEASYNGIRKFFEAQKGENDHVDDSTSGLAERAGRGSDSDRVGPDDAGGESGRRSGRGVQETERAVQPEGGARVRDRSAAAGGETGNSRVQVEESGDRAGSAGSAHVSRSVRDSYEGSVGHDADRNAADIRPAQNRRDNASPAGARARAVKPNKSGKRGDLGSIKNDLPMLKPEQQEDVEFIETRVNVNNKPGVMLTNGTGTGKTYSGLGFIKRMYDAGKKNILIVSPSESINDQWIEAANKHFDLSIEKLSSTKDSGKDGGICITTYANLQANRELVNRNWDAVVSDESHTLMQNEKGEETGYLSMLRALTLNPRGAYKRWKLQHRTKEIRSLENQIEEREKKAKAILRPYKDKKKVSSADKAKVDALQKEIEDLNKEMEGIFWKMSPGTDKLMQDLKAAYPEEKRPKVLFLSATPFSHDKDIDYAEGYLFHYDEDTGRYGGYNVGTPSDQFMVKHFGYRMRTGKLTRPDAEVDSRAMEVQFHDDLVNSGAMHGRQIAVDKDYDRGFILVDGGIGHKIDEGFKFLSDNHVAYGELYRVLAKQFNKSQQKYLIESIKAREVIPLIQEYVKKGKKVVLFHQSMVEHKNIHPFQLKPSADLAENSEVWAQWKAFKSARPDLVNLSLGNIPAPMETLRKELGGHAVFINGSVLEKDRAKNIEQFNDDNSGVNIIVCQQDAANAGISLHDTTGKHPRVLINIAMPERPSYAMQIKGRIYRVGNASNAVFRYLSTGTDIEKNMFASTIGGRAASVENLAVGNAARGLRESFRDLYQETMDGSWRRRLPGAKGEGTGGKEMDYAVTADLSEYDRAKSFYFAHQKRTSRTKAQEGNDYFATPEPIGYKMVEWLGLKSGEKALEPSAGHGAISRWFPETTERTIVEPSGKLMPLAQMNTPGAKAVHGSFEDFNIVNKFDGIAMNPPYGTGGKTAIEHLQKAFKQLHDGGRVVAIIPEGPAADKRYSKMMEEISSEVVPIADIHLPAVAFSRAGTKVGTHIVVLDRYTGKAAHQAALDHFGDSEDINLRNIDSIKDLFDRMESIALPERLNTSDLRKGKAMQPDKAKTEDSPDETPNFTADEYERTDTHETKFRAHPKSYLGKNYRPIQKMAKAHGGKYSHYANYSFLFDDKDERDAFLQEAEEYLSDNKYSAEEAADAQERALSDIKQEVASAFPNAKNVRDNGHEVLFSMPNGAEVSVSIVPSIEVTESEESNARAAHGLAPEVHVKISGKERTIGSKALIELSQLGRKGTAYHEAFHAVYDMCLTEREKAALHKAYDKEAKGRDVYEVMADKYRDWMIAKQKGQHTLYGKLWQKVKDAAARLMRVVRGADNAGDVFRRVASGEAWERPLNEVGSDTRYAAEQKGAQSFLKTAASKLGKRMGVKSDKIITEEAKAKEGIGILDYLIASPSRVATRVESFRQFYRMGVRAMDVLTERRSYYQRKLGRAMQLVKSKNDYEELTDILLSGDAEGKEWTKEELIQSGTKENVAEAYTRIRRLMRQAYKMVNEAHKHPKTYSKRLSESKIEELRQNPFVKIMKIHDEEDDGRHLVTYREFANYEHTLEGVTKQALDEMRVDEDMQVLEATKQADGTYKVRVREGRGDVTNRKGYIPHFFHNYMVEVRDEDGNYVTTITSGRTQREAVKKAEEWMKDNKLEDGQKIYIHPKIFDFTRYGMSEKGIVQLGDKDFYALMNRVAKDNDMSFEEAKDLLQNVHQKNRHRFFGNVLHRKGVSGFETDMNYVLSHYFNSASRYYAMETEFKPQAISLYERLFGDFAKDSKSSLAQYVKDYINDVNGTPSALERGVNDALMRSKVYRDFVVSHYGERAVLQLSSNIAGATTYMCLGYFNVSSALLNLTQVMNSAAYIGDVSALGKCLSKGMHRKYSLHDLKVLKETNVLNDIGLDSGSGYDVNRMSAKNLLGKINKASMSFFKVSEQTVRIGTVLAAYESGIKRGMSHEEAIDFAKEVNQKSNFDYSVADAPNIFRRGSFLAQLALQFKKYGIKELEVMADMLSPRTSRKQKLIFWGTYLLAAGLCGLPALDWLDPLLAWVTGTKSPKLAVQAAIMEAAGGTPMGKFIGRMAMYGLPSSLVGVDLSSRVGLSDVVPTELKNLLPPLATKIPQFMQDIFSEAKINAVRDFSPAIYNQIAAWGTGKSYDKRGRINAEYNTFYDKLLRSIGFKSTDERVDSDIRRITSERRSELTKKKQEAVDAYIAHPTPQNMQKLKDLGVKDSTVEKERERKKEDSYNRTKGGMTKKEAQENQKLLNFK